MGMPSTSAVAVLVLSTLAACGQQGALAGDAAPKAEHAFAAAQFLGADCAGRKLQYHIQFPRAKIADDAPIFLMFHEAGADDKGSLTWLNEQVPAVVRLREEMDARGWIYVCPYYYDWWQGSSPKEIEAGGATYEALVEQIKGLLRERGAKTEHNPVYLAGASFGGNRALLLAKRAPEHCAGLVLIYSAIQAYAQHDYHDFALTPYDYTRLTMPVHMSVSLGEDDIGPAMMRLYALISRSPKTTITYIMDSSSAHDPRNFDTAAMMDTLTGGHVGSHVLEQRTPDRHQVEPYIEGALGGDNVAFYPQQAYQVPVPEIGPKARLNVKDPILVAGSPRQAASGRKRVVVLTDDADAGAMAYGTARGAKDWLATRSFAQYYRSFTATVSGLGWQWVVPASIPTERILVETAARCPGFDNGTIAIGMGVGVQRLATLVSAPAVVEGVMMIDPAITDAEADTLLKALPPATPLVLAAPAADDSPVSAAARRLYDLAKAQQRPVLFIEKRFRPGEMTWPIVMHVGTLEFDFLRQAKPGAFRRVVISYLKPEVPSHTQQKLEEVEKSTSSK